ncbi:MAG: HAD family hydrolase [Opitutaceae bacterium]|nr:HAD family hydrolase [Opitutaceae bacterium]
MHLRTAFFDLDGTLVDHFAAIHRSYVHTLPQLGLPAPTLAQVRDAVGGGLDRAMLRFVTPAQLPAALAIYRPYFDRTMLDDVVLLPGAREALESLSARRVACAVLTNKDGPASRRLCQHLGITPWLKGIFGAHDTPWLKPDVRVVKHVLAEMKLPAEGLLMVGDSPFDVQTGILSGFPCWAVTTGTHSSDQLQAAGAARVFPDLPALMSALLAEIPQS